MEDLILLPFRVASNVLAAADWFCQVAPILYEAATSKEVRKAAEVRERYQRRFGSGYNRPRPRRKTRAGKGRRRK